jgi:hypothetical protein
VLCFRPPPSARRRALMAACNISSRCTEACEPAASDRRLHGRARAGGTRWCRRTIVVAAAFHEWDRHRPAWACPRCELPYALAPLYQRVDPSAPRFIHNRGREAAVYLRFVVDYYDALPELMVFVQADVDEGHRRGEGIAHQTEKALRELTPEAMRSRGVGYLPLNKLLIKERNPTRVPRWRGGAHIIRCWREVASLFGLEQTLGWAEPAASSPAPTSAWSTVRDPRPAHHLGERASGDARGHAAHAQVAVVPHVVPTLTFACCNYFAVLSERVRRLPREVWAAAYNRTVSRRGACDSLGDAGAGKVLAQAADGEEVVHEERDPTGMSVAGAFESLAHAVWGGWGAHYAGPMGVDALMRQPLV